MVDDKRPRIPVSRAPVSRAEANSQPTLSPPPPPALGRTNFVPPRVTPWRSSPGYALGLGSVPFRGTTDPLQPSDSIARAREVEKSLDAQGIFKRAPLTVAEILKQRALISGLPGLEPADYEGQRKESQDLARMQLGLALAQRGFAAMGAQPQRGESPLGTLGRTLASPLAGDASTVAGQLMKQRQAAKLAERADKARLSQAALTMTQQNLEREGVRKDKLFALAKSLTERDYTPTKDLQRRVKVDGKEKWVDFVGFNYTDKVTGLPAIAGVNRDGELNKIPFEDLRYYRKPATVTATKAVGSTYIDRVVQFPIRNTDGSVKKWEDVKISQIRQIIPIPGDPKMEWGRDVFHLGSTIPLQTRDRLTNKLRNVVEGIDFLGTDKDSYHIPKEKKYYIRPDLNNTDFAAARNLLGSKDLKRGEGIVRWDFRHKVDPEQSKTWYDVKGNRADLTPDQANKYLQTEKPKIEDPFPAGGEPFGTTIKDLTVIDKVTKEPKTIQAVLMQTAPGKFRWKETGADGKFVDEQYQKPFWGTIKEEKFWRFFRPVLNAAFKTAIGLRTDLEPDVLEKLEKHVLTQADLKRLAPLEEAARTEAINDIINGRVLKITGQQPETVASVPEDVIELEPRVKALVTVPQGAIATTRPVVNPRIFQPWTKGGKNIQLGTGSHGGFTQKITATDVLTARKNWPAIKQSFERAFQGARQIGDQEERILLFSGLWKNLPGVAKGQKARTLSDSAFRANFDKATGLYNAAAKAYKPAAEINIGKGAQAKNLQTSLDDQMDAIRDNVLMLRFKDQAGAWFSDGGWLAEFRGSGLGELWEEWSGNDGTASETAYDAMPTSKWADIAKPDNQLNAADLALKKKAFAYLSEKAKAEKGRDIGLTEFERAAEYLGAVARYRIRAFDLIKDSRPSDKDIEILLGAFVGKRDSNSVVFAKLHELQNRHVKGLSRRLNQGIALKAVYDPVFLADLDHTSRALQRTAIRDLDPRPGGRAAESSALFQRSSATIRRAVEDASGRIVPGYRGGAISPLSGNVDEESTANLYRRVLSAAKEAYPDKPDAEALTEFVRQGFHLTRFLGVYGTQRQTTPPFVQEPDGSITIR